MLQCCWSRLFLNMKKRRTTPKQLGLALCLSTFWVHLYGNRKYTTSLSLAPNKQWLFASSSSGMSLFELPMQLDDHTEGNRAISFLTGEETWGSQEHQPQQKQSGTPPSTAYPQANKRHLFSGILPLTFWTDLQRNKKNVVASYQKGHKTLRVWEN